MRFALKQNSFVANHWWTKKGSILDGYAFVIKNTCLRRAVTENIINFLCLKTNFPFYKTKLQIMILTFNILKLSVYHNINIYILILIFHNIKLNIYILILIFHNVKLNCYYKTNLLIIMLTSEQYWPPYYKTWHGSFSHSTNFCNLRLMSFDHNTDLNTIRLRSFNCNAKFCIIRLQFYVICDA